jgi:hypothetical protein
MITAMLIVCVGCVSALTISNSTERTEDEKAQSMISTNGTSTGSDIDENTLNVEDIEIASITTTEEDMEVGMEKILTYLIDVDHLDPEIAAIIASPLERHNDIRAELEKWIELQVYPQDNPLTIEGYTAEEISKLAPFMDGVAAYNFMVALREDPDYAKRLIAGGFNYPEMDIRWSEDEEQQEII